MRYKEARSLVLEGMEVIDCVVQKPFAFARIKLHLFGRDYHSVGFSKYRRADAKEGLPWSAKQGRRLATGRAVKKLAKRIVASGVQSITLDVHVTGAKLIERGGNRYLIPEGKTLAAEAAAQYGLNREVS